MACLALIFRAEYTSAFPSHRPKKHNGVVAAGEYGDLCMRPGYGNE
jgi:hypothetical protein